MALSTDPAGAQPRRQRQVTLGVLAGMLFASAFARIWSRPPKAEPRTAALHLIAGTVLGLKLLGRRWVVVGRNGVAAQAQAAADHGATGR